ncbi:MAG: glycoside hydrolase family 125 protein [Armatimonadota bacterium]|jgi:hypothetical protein
MKRLSTGNEYISIPDICTETGGIRSAGFTHLGFRACVEMNGSDTSPLLAPFLEVDGQKPTAEDIQNRLISYWIPEFTVDAFGVEATATIFAPADRRGFIYSIKLENSSGLAKRIRAGWRGCWESTCIASGKCRPMTGTKHASIDPQRSVAPVIEFRGNTPLFAIAFVPEEDMTARLWNGECDDKSLGCLNVSGNAPIFYDFLSDFELAAGERKTMTIYVGIGLEETSATASAAEMQLQGWERLLASLGGWLDRRVIECEDADLKHLMNLNSFYNYFYSQATTLDTEQLVLTSARSSQSESCGVYRDRHAMRWSLPAVLHIHWSQARKMLIYAFTKQLNNVGMYGRFIDGILLEPGLALDQLCAPLRALQMYLQITEDMSILFDRRVQTGINTIKDILTVQRNPKTMLFETLWTPSGEVSKYPYNCMANVLAWRILIDLGLLYDRIRDLDRVDEATAISNKLRSAIQKHFVVKGPLGDMFARSVDLKGNFELGDDSEGSLKLLTYFGFCAPHDGVYNNTMAWLDSEHNPNRTDDLSLLDLVNDLLASRSQEALEFLSKAKLDDGIACDTINPADGRVIAGRANAAYAGYLAFGLHYALDAALPKAATVQKQRKPTGTLYQPPPEMNQQSKKARI